MRERRSAERAAADDLLSGRTGPGEAPTGLRAVARLLRVAAQPAAARTDTGPDERVAAIAALVRQTSEEHAGRVGAAAGGTTSGVERSWWRRSSARGRATLRPRAVATLLGLALFGSTAGAAFAGALPAAEQSRVSAWLSQVGVHVPDGRPVPAALAVLARDGGAHLSPLSPQEHDRGWHLGWTIAPVVSDGRAKAGMRGAGATRGERRGRGSAAHGSANHHDAHRSTDGNGGDSRHGGGGHGVGQSSGDTDSHDRGTATNGSPSTSHAGH